MATDSGETFRFTINRDRSGWFKLVQSVDLSKQSGYAFLGPFLPVGQQIELPVKSVIIRKYPVPGKSKFQQEGSAYVPEPDNENDGFWILKEIVHVTDWFSQILDFRDAVHELLVGLGIDNIPPVEWLTERREVLLEELRQIENQLDGRTTIKPTHSGRLIITDEDEL